MAPEITESNFDQLITKASLPVMLDCFASWCGPCRQLLPVVDDLADQWRNKVYIAKMDVDKCPNLASKFQIRSVPTLLFFRDGVIVDKQLGNPGRAALEQKLGSF